MQQIAPRLVAQIHDELIFEVASGAASLKNLAKAIKHLMEGALLLNNLALGVIGL